MALTNINDIDAWEQFVRRLIEKTRSGDITWEDWTRKISRDDCHSPLFVATHSSWRILIYRYRYKEYRDEDHYQWDEDVSMEIIDPKGLALWTIPKVPARFALLDFIQFKFSDVQSLFSEIVGSPEGAKQG